MKNKVKNEKGVISVFATLAMLFFLLFILGAYIAIARSNRTQRETNAEIKKIFSTDINSQEVYDSMIAESSETIIPLYTFAQINNIGSGNLEAIDGKIFYYRNPMSVLYQLRSNLNLDDSAYGQNIFLGEYEYSNIESMKLSLDGINNCGLFPLIQVQDRYIENNIKLIDLNNNELSNQGIGHYTNVNTWKNLINKEKLKNSLGKKIRVSFRAEDQDASASSDIVDPNMFCKIYSGGNKMSINVNWIENGLSLDGSGDYVKANGILGNAGRSQTYEIVFKTTSAKKGQNLIGNFNDLKHGETLGITQQMKLMMGLKTQNRVFHCIGDTNLNANQIYYAAMTFDGNNVVTYLNGKKEKERAVSSSNSSYTTKIKTLNTITDVANKITVGLDTRISNNGTKIVISPDIVESNGYEISSNSTILVSGDSGDTYNGSTYQINISNLQVKYLNNTYIFEKNGYVLLTTPFEFRNIEINNIFATGSILHPVCRGSNSMIIRSDVGKISSWTFNGVERSPASNNGEVEIMGYYYYYFDGLEPNKEYEIVAKYNSFNDITDLDNSNVEIGKGILSSVDGTWLEDFEGIIYAARVYDGVLTEDSIRANYLIDKSRYRIQD